MDNFGNRFMEILSYPLVHRCSELTMIFDRCSIKELQEVFPVLVNSIFGANQGLGWGLRTITPIMNPQEFDILFNFFISLGPMFRLCYKLLNDALKFDIPISNLPTKMRQMLESGRYPLFYADLINVDSFTRQISYISLNPFDYYMIHFAIHGMIPLHKMYPMALKVHTEKWKTVYFLLTADYICSFLPSDPDVVVMPQNICGNIKASPPMQMTSIQPTRSPIYIQLSALTRHSTSTPNTRVVESPRTNAWRSESVLYIFIDCWLRYNVDDSRDLPSSEFIRVLRVLVKRIHLFGNAADIDNSSMAQLRKLAQPMMSAQMYAFLSGIISRWPLDCSFMVVLELWLSYIQPWRYIYDRDSNTSDFMITAKHELFIQENLIDYTQIFVQLLPRFERLDLSSIKNVLMLYRLMKVFGQPKLADILKQIEATVPPSGWQQQFNSSPMKNADKSLSNNFMDKSYTFMFRSPVTDNVKHLLRKISIAEIAAREEKIIAENMAHKNQAGIWNTLLSIFSNNENMEQNVILQDKRRIPEILLTIGQTLSYIFEINISEGELKDVSRESSKHISDTFQSFESTHNFERSIPSPSAMRRNIPVYTGDPALIPIQSNEFTILVRFFHQLSCKLNIMFSQQLNEIWLRRDMWGKLGRPLLTPPMTIQYIDKSSGITVFRDQHLGPRISLRFLASYRTFILVLLSFLFGQIFFNIPSSGFLLLILFSFIYCYTQSLFCGPVHMN